jgi:RNase H-fold protein (predicted Holliday junction resolvase)
MVKSIDGSYGRVAVVGVDAGEKSAGVDQVQSLGICFTPVTKVNALGCRVGLAKDS